MLTCALHDGLEPHTAVLHVESIVATVNTAEAAVLAVGSACPVAEGPVGLALLLAPTDERDDVRVVAGLDALGRVDDAAGVLREGREVRPHVAGDRAAFVHLLHDLGLAADETPRSDLCVKDMSARYV